MMTAPTSPQASLPSHSSSSWSSSVIPSPSCSASASAASPTPNKTLASASPTLPSWHFPFGPSSKYHLSERPQRSHQRVKTSYTPRAPVLSTEQRAHRRAQNISLGSFPSPSPSEYSRSPLSRLSSHSSASSAKYPGTMARSTNGAPLTPAKTSRRTSSLQQSPFSDYFSDDARSALNTNVPAPSMETKALLVKMNKLQSQLMRDQSDKGHQAISVVGRKLAEIDAELESLHAHSQLPIDLDDSAIFMSGEKITVQTPQHSRGPSCQSCNSLDSSVASSKIFDEEVATLKQYQAERTWYLGKTQELLEKLNTVQAELRQRHADFAELHERHYTVIEEKEAEIEQLRSENEGLRQDLGFEYSELLFLKLQMKSLEVDIDDLRNINNTQLSSEQRTKKNEILSEMDRWRTDSDWQDVEARFKRRRSKYGIPTSPVRKDSARANSDITAQDEIDWQLETVREDRGRITSLTIKRTDSTQRIPQNGEETVITEQTAQPVTLGGSTGSAAGDPFDFTANKADAESLPRSYADQDTQTDISIAYPLDEDEPHFITQGGLRGVSGDDQEEDIEETYEEEEETEDHDYSITGTQGCAIHISEPAEADEDLYQDVEEDEETILEEATLLSVPHKSAWQELWSSLSSLTGIPDDEEDEY